MTAEEAGAILSARAGEVIDKVEVALAGTPPGLGAIAMVAYAVACLEAAFERGPGPEHKVLHVLAQRSCAEIAALLAKYPLPEKTAPTPEAP